MVFDSKMPIDPTQELDLIKKFLLESVRRRCLALSNPTKRRQFIIDKLAHGDLFQDKYLHKITPSRHYSKMLLEDLEKKGASSECYIISENSKIDQKKMNLREALEYTVGFSIGTIICCIPNKLLYYEAEGLGERYIIQ